MSLWPHLSPPHIVLFYNIKLFKFLEYLKMFHISVPLPGKPLPLHFPLCLSIMDFTSLLLKVAWMSQLCYAFTHYRPNTVKMLYVHFHLIFIVIIQNWYYFFHLQMKKLSHRKGKYFFPRTHGNGMRIQSLVVSMQNPCG